MAGLSAARPDHRPRLHRLRWLFLILLLVGELITLSVIFDTGVFTTDGPAAIILGQSHVVPRVLIAAAGILVILSIGRRRDGLRRHPSDFSPLSDPERGLGERISRPYRWWPYLAIHMVAFALFTFLTEQLWHTAAVSSPVFALLVSDWVATGLLAVISLGFAGVPPDGWKELILRSRWLLLIAALLGAAAWAAGQLTDVLWEPLAGLTLQLVRWFLQLLTAGVICDAETRMIGTETFAVTIAPECSGYEGIGLTWMFLAIYLWSFRRELRFPAALLLMPIGTLLIWLANAVRIAALILLGAYVSPEVALGGFHSQAGWIAFNLVVVGLVLISRRWSLFRVAEPASESAPASATAAYLLPFLSLLAVGLLTRAFAPEGLDWAYPLRILAVAGVLWLFRGHYRLLRWTWSWEAVTIGVLVFVLWVALHLATSPASRVVNVGAELAAVPAGLATAWIVLRLLGSVVFVPLAEELAFRGYLTRRLISARWEAVPAGTFRWAAFLVSSLLFGLAHDQVLAGTLAGMAYAVAWYRRGELTDAVVAHAVTNALLAGYVLTTGDWTLWT